MRVEFPTSRGGLQAACVVILAGLLSVRPGIAQTPEPPLVVGLLRADGVALPVGVYSDSGWHRIRQPSDLARYDLRSWHYYVSGGRSGRSNIPNPDSVVGDFNDPFDMWGQATDFPPWQFDEHVRPIRRIGVLTNRPVAASALDEVEPDSSLLAIVLSDYERLEKAEVGVRRKSTDGTRTWDEIPVDDNARQAVAPMERGSAHRMRVDDNRSIYMVRFHKMYAGSPGTRCGLAMTTYEGWVLVENSRRAIIHSVVIFGGCDDRTFFSHIPYGLVSLGDIFFAIGEDLGYEWTCYQVFELNLLASAWSLCCRVVAIELSR
jgi:hypothetical protein